MKFQDIKPTPPGFFLTKEEVETLTGYKRFSDQRAWLTRRGWVFEEAITGRPVVLRAFAESRMGNESDARRTWQPNLAVIKKPA